MVEPWEENQETGNACVAVVLTQEKDVYSEYYSHIPADEAAPAPPGSAGRPCLPRDEQSEA